MTSLSRSVRWTIAIIVVLIILIAGFFLVQHQNRVADPKNNCSLLQSPSEVNSALNNNSQLTHEFESISKNVKVSQTEACDGEKAIISISYSEDSEKEKIEKKINEGPYYGVATEVVKNS